MTIDIARLRLREVRPSQFWVSEEKLRAVRAWFRPDDLSGFEPIPVRVLDGVPVMTDGHTRAVAALLAGLDAVPMVPETDELDWEMYRRCAAACAERGVFTPADLADRVIPADEYREAWDRWCDRMQEEVLRGRAGREEGEP